MSQWDQDLEQGRRVAFWQRVYLQCLAQLVGAWEGCSSSPASQPLAKQAGEHAAMAVRQLDEWLETTQPAQAPAPGRDPSPSEDDGPDGGYLGS